jgi:uncharacterized protein YjiS (DUF1127 family)
MTISQSCSSQNPGLWLAGAMGALRALARWRERRRAQADLDRLAQVGDYLLRDVGLDPMIIRQNPTAALDRMARR